MNVRTVPQFSCHSMFHDAFLISPFFTSQVLIRMSYNLQRRGGPYLLNSAGLGGLPTVHADIPICAVFLFLYICFAVANGVLFRHNHRRHHKFMLSILLVAFCWARVATLVLRIVWATRPYNIRVAIAAQILLNAGILIVYIINLVLAQRILRAKQPNIGWNPILRATYKALYLSIGAALVTVITSVVVSFYTLNPHTRSQCRDIQLAVLTYLLVFISLPLLHVMAVLILPKSNHEEAFGEGSMTSKLVIVTLSSCLGIIIAGFKAGANWSPPRPANNPAWYDSKACLYVFNFAMETLTLCVLTFGRIDKRFFVPNGCKGPGDYTRLKTQMAMDTEEGGLKAVEDAKPKENDDGIDEHTTSNKSW